ncbi:MAG TPA: helix-turn-helix domain-containing protein [Solirubrobacteraceae bacterium]|nr:helix-turn-helix domain-containing protein [Solirubrobacteraceae bacterium]
MEAALDLFSEEGYDHTGVAQIAERAGLTKTTFFRHFRDKREVLFAGQEAHCQMLADAIAEAPSSATPLESVAAALDAIAVSFPPERREFATRLRAVLDAYSELQEREALKHAGYAAAMSDALRQRGVSDPTAIVAAELGVLAFKTAFACWTENTHPQTLPQLARQTLHELHAASASLQ